MTLYIDNCISCCLSVSNKLQVTFDSIYYFCSDFSPLEGQISSPSWSALLATCLFLSKA